MEWLNYHHLLYFWTVAREGSIARACHVLHLSQPTISNQLRKLEGAIGGKLFLRVGRNLQLTETGRMVYRYAEEIFTIGRELKEAVDGTAVNRPLRLAVGVSDVLPKLVVSRLLRPAFELDRAVHLVCREGKPAEMLAELEAHELDLVLSDAPAGTTTRGRMFSHLLGQCGVAFFGAPELAKKYRRGFPESLGVAPLLLPTRNTSLRKSCALTWRRSSRTVPCSRSLVRMDAVSSRHRQS